jgi:hypothetical protein
MLDQIEQTIAFFDEMMPESLVGAMILSMVIALSVCSLYRFVCRTRSNASTLLLCLVFVANLASMISAVCFIQSRIPTVRTVRPNGRRQGERVSYAYDHIARPDTLSVRRLPEPPSIRLKRSF